MSLFAVTRDEYSAPFFDGTAAGTLLLRRCGDCDHWSEPGALLCARCRSGNLAWAASAGGGELVSWTVVPGRPKDGVVPPPEVVALVQTPEGPWVHMAVVGCDGRDLTAGTQVAVEFAAVDGGEVLPVARPT